MLLSNEVTLLFDQGTKCGIDVRRGLYGGSWTGLTLSILAVSPAASGAAIVLYLVNINYITVNLVN